MRRWLCGVGGGAVCRGTDAVSSSRGGGRWSRGVPLHFINPVESVSFKENRARMNYLFVGVLPSGTQTIPLSSLLLSIKKSHCLNNLAPRSLFFKFSKNKTLTGRQRMTDRLLSRWVDSSSAPPSQRAVGAPARVQNFLSC